MSLAVPAVSALISPSSLYWPSMTQRMGAKGQVVIPKELREQIGIGPGDDVTFEPVDEGIVVRRAGDRPALRGRFAKSGMAARLIEDRGEEPR
jgi:antitoxin PrlF